MVEPRLYVFRWTEDKEKKNVKQSQEKNLKFRKEKNTLSI